MAAGGQPEAEAHHQKLAAAFEQVDADVAEMRSRFRRNRNYMVAAFREMGLPLIVPRGAFYAFPRVSGLGMSGREFALALLEEEKVAVVPGEAFGAGGADFVRCSYSTSLENVKEAMQRMARFVSSVSGTRSSVARS